MAYTIPEMPLLCRLWSWDAADPDDWREEDVPCNLAWGRRVLTGDLQPASASLDLGPCAKLLVPAGTDIRGYANTIGEGDLVEVPQDSGRFYFAVLVDDVGKGFPNEHRFALLSVAGNWTPPYP